VVISTEKYSFAQLDEEASGRRDQRSFHVFAEGQHSDVRGQIFNLDKGGEISLPHDRWPHQLFVVVGIDGSVDADVDGRTFAMGPHSQLVVLPGTPCKLTARSAAAVELISLLSMPPRATG
jgi:hypothetical protein